MFGNIKEVYWLSKILLSKNRENNISDCFDVEVNFKCAKHLEEFDELLNFFQRRKEKIVMTIKWVKIHCWTDLL